MNDDNNKNKELLKYGLLKISTKRRKILPPIKMKVRINLEDAYFGKIKQYPLKKTDYNDHKKNIVLNIPLYGNDLHFFDSIEYPDVIIHLFDKPHPHYRRVNEKDLVRTVSVISNPKDVYDLKDDKQDISKKEKVYEIGLKREKQVIQDGGKTLIKFNNIKATNLFLKEEEEEEHNKYMNYLRKELEKKNTIESNNENKVICFKHFDDNIGWIKINLKKEQLNKSKCLKIPGLGLPDPRLLPKEASENKNRGCLYLIIDSINETSGFLLDNSEKITEINYFELVNILDLWNENVLI